MAREDVAAGKVKQVKGKANDTLGALKGDTSQQIKGKVQKAVGKVQEKLGKGGSTRPNPTLPNGDSPSVPRFVMRGGRAVVFRLAPSGFAPSGLRTLTSSSSATCT
jgi:uncharacterized protein YjbJ (UPF0337 family)